MSSAWTNRLTAKALSRTRDFTALARPYDETNANDDHGRNGREDYSVLLLAPDSITLTVTQPAYAGPWTTRASGDTTSATAGWGTRRTGTATTATMSWTTRASGSENTSIMAWAPRRTGTTTTTTAAWTTRRTGTLTS